MYIIQQCFTDKYLKQVECPWIEKELNKQSKNYTLENYRVIKKKKWNASTGADLEKCPHYTNWEKSLTQINLHSMITFLKRKICINIVENVWMNLGKAEKIGIQLLTVTAS